MAKYLLYVIFGIFLIGIALYDLRYKLVSPIVVVLGVLIILPIQIYLGKTSFTLWGLVGGIVVSSTVYYISELLGRITKRQYFGFGDIWVSGFIGCALGFKGFIGVFICAFYIQLIIGLALYFAKRIKFHEEIPFVSMLALASGVNALYGSNLVSIGLRLLTKLEAGG